MGFATFVILTLFTIDSQMYVEVFKQTFLQSKVDPSAVKKIFSVGLEWIQEIDSEGKTWTVRQ